MDKDPVVIVGSARTPMGGFQGDFATVAAPALGAHRRSLQIGGDVLVGSRHGGRPMPGSLIVLTVPVGHRGQRFMHAPAVLGCRTVVHRGTDQGMTEGNTRLQHHNPLLHSRIGHGDGNTQQCTGSPHS